MSRIPTHELKSGEIHRIALLAREIKFEDFKKMLDLVRVDVADKLGKLTDTPELFRNQGIKQFVDELYEIFKKGLDWDK